jgi:transcriptional regulator with XRE-family HTH domain
VIDIPNIMKKSSISNKNGEIIEEIFATKLHSMAKSLKDRLKEEMKKRGIKVPALSEQTEIPKDRIYAWYRDDSNPKAEDQSRLEEWLKGEISTEKGETSMNTISEPTANYNRNREDRILDAIDRLSKSHDKIIDQHAVIVDTNAKLANRLVEINSVKPEDDPLTDPAMRAQFLGLLAELGVSAKKWRSKQEALAELHKFSHAGKAITK